VARVPPDDPEDWSNDEWLDYLAETDAAAAPAPGRPVSAAGAFARSGAGGAIGAAMKGLHRAIYGGQEDEIAIVADASGDPPGPEGLDVHLDPDDPGRSTVVVKRPVDAARAPQLDEPPDP